MPIPDYQTLMLPVLRLAERETRVADVAERIADELGLAQEEREELLPSGRQRLLHNRIHWAKFYMSKAGFIASPARGRFVATERGKALLATAPERIDVALLLQEPMFREFYRNEGAVEQAGVIAKPLETASLRTTPEEQIDAAHAALQSALRDELLQRVLANSPAFFELLIVDLLVAMGYGGSHKDAATQLGRSGDGGVDGIVNEDRLGLDRIYVQAKRYAPANPVGRPDVNGFVGSLVGLGATKGVFVTTSTFSQPVRDYVKHLAQRVILIDGQELADLMIEHGVGVRSYRTVEFKRLDEDFFGEE
ncbi:MULTISPECIES: restriction endonuclease [unclassified Rhizobium]|uniref:restriction endonuclease n=1 Tax=unclassified Rhizobium TaxID=2613769 RepID=UPI0007EC0849|nr:MULTISPECIES: restriction endonuclease [unclassified Rhizobium]ANK90548.1 restriction endonuclease protein Mrr [Rhizobium sp. N6212]ANK96576.1 restriction endonuclease protein Mrr [Rhizobium sp. N621]